jgi:hypothetical protein
MKHTESVHAPIVTTFDTGNGSVDGRPIIFLRFYGETSLSEKVVIAEVMLELELADALAHALTDETLAARFPRS